MSTWKTQPSTPLQQKKIMKLMKTYERYTLTFPLEKLTKGQAHYLIESLQGHNLEKLLEKNVLRLLEEEPYTVAMPQETSSPVIYRISGGEDLYAYSRFRTEVKGHLLDYKTEGFHILYQIIQVEHALSQETMDKYPLLIEKLQKGP